MRIIATSDLHGHLPDIPKCDVLIIGGDICPDRPGNYMAQDKAEWQIEWLNKEFREWLQMQPADFIVGIAGNHDFGFEMLHRAQQRLDLPWTYLLDSGTEIRDKNAKDKTIKLWGIPWVPNLRRWAFYGSDLLLHTSYSEVPKDTDIVISHGPPKGLLDFTDHRGGGHVGSEQALSMLDRVSPKAFVCGHIHEGFGKDRFYGTDVYNVSYVDEHYVPRYATAVLDGFE